MDALLEKAPRAVQMNTRLDSLLKKQGDAALAAAGYSPSQAVRSLWSFAARHAAQPERIANAIDSLDKGEENRQNDEREKKLIAAHAGWKLLDDTLEQLGMKALEIRALPGDTDEDTLYEEALFERYQDRGLL